MHQEHRVQLDKDKKTYTKRMKSQIGVTDSNSTVTTMREAALHQSHANGHTKTSNFDSQCIGLFFVKMMDYINKTFFRGSKSSGSRNLTSTKYRRSRNAVTLEVSQISHATSRSSSFSICDIVLSD